MGTTKANVLNTLAEEVTTELRQHQTSLPAWIVRELLETQLEAASLDVLSAASDQAHDHIVAAIVELILRHTHQRDKGSPAALDLTCTGQVITALGVVAHLAITNSHTDKWTALNALAESAEALIGLGTALSDADRITASTVLLTPTTTTAAHQAITGTMKQLRNGDWTPSGTGAGSNENYLHAVLRTALHNLPPPTT